MITFLLFSGQRSTAPLWDRQPYTSAHSSQLERIQRSISSNTLNRGSSASNLRSLSQYKPQGLWGSSINSPSNVFKASSSQSALLSHIKKKKDFVNGDQDSSDDDSSLSDSETYSRTLRPGTPPKPNIFRQIRRSSTSQNVPTAKPSEYIMHRSRKLWDNFELRSSKSEYNLNYIGQENISMPSRSNTSTPINSGLWGIRSHTENVENDKFDLSSSNPATAQLTTELCQHIVDELNHIATFTKKIYHRCYNMGKTSLCSLLVDGVSKAYVNLSTVVPPPPTNGDVSTIANSSDYANSLPPESMINTMNLLQQYSDRLLSMVEQRMTKDNAASDGNKAANTENVDKM